MKPVLLIDFGSTYTKVTAVDVESETLLGTASSYTTVQTDIGEGLQNALDILEQKTGKLNFAERYACSSAAGGLRMITSGLVPELTAEAAKQASLGAGAKVIRVYSYELTKKMWLKSLPAIQICFCLWAAPTEETASVFWPMLKSFRG